MSKKISSVSFIVLIFGILTFSTSFILLNCGSGSTLKTWYERGPYAVLFNGQTSKGVIDMNWTFDFRNSPVTAEAWIKTTADKGSIVKSGYKENGYFLYVMGGKAGFMVASSPLNSDYPPPGLVDGYFENCSPCATSTCVGGNGGTCDTCTSCNENWFIGPSCTYTFEGSYDNTCSTCTDCYPSDAGYCLNCASCTNLNPGVNATTTCRATSTLSVNSGTWRHVAGVITDTDHSDDSYHEPCAGSCDCGGAEAGIHIDIYVDGEFRTCAAALSYIVGLPTVEGKWKRDKIGFDEAALGPDNQEFFFNGVIDEVRLWQEARTGTQIAAAYNTEITFKNRGEHNPNDTLKGYWKFNEGAGISVVDSSGINNNDGVMEYCSGSCSD